MRDTFEVDDYPTEVDLRDLQYCKCVRSFNSRYVKIIDLDNRTFRIKEVDLADILKYQVRMLRVVFKYGIHYLEPLIPIT